MPVSVKMHSVFIIILISCSSLIIPSVQCSLISRIKKNIKSRIEDPKADKASVSARLTASTKTTHEVPLVTPEPSYDYQDYATIDYTTLKHISTTVSKYYRRKKIIRYMVKKRRIISTRSAKSHAIARNNTKKTHKAAREIVNPGPPADDPPVNAPPPAAVAQCFYCNMDAKPVPITRACTRAFHDPYYSGFQYWFKSSCFVGANANGSIVKPGKTVNKGKGLTELTGSFMTNSCFYRFTDVGELYSERGCRMTVPWEGTSLASARFSMLEGILDIKDDCVTSPYSTYLPFTRARLGLFVRFHSCVCKGEYCNMCISQTSVNIVIYLIALMFSIYLW